MRAEDPLCGLRLPAVRLTQTPGAAKTRRRRWRTAVVRPFGVLGFATLFRVEVAIRPVTFPDQTSRTALRPRLSRVARVGALETGGASRFCAPLGPQHTSWYSQFAIEWRGRSAIARERGRTGTRSRVASVLPPDGGAHLIARRLDAALSQQRRPSPRIRSIAGKEDTPRVADLDSDRPALLGSRARRCRASTQARAGVRRAMRACEGTRARHRASGRPRAR